MRFAEAGKPAGRLAGEEKALQTNGPASDGTDLKGTATKSLSKNAVRVIVQKTGIDGLCPIRRSERSRLFPEIIRN